MARSVWGHPVVSLRHCHRIREWAPVHIDCGPKAAGYARGFFPSTRSQVETLAWTGRDRDCLVSRLGVRVRAPARPSPRAPWTAKQCQRHRKSIDELRWPTGSRRRTTSSSSTATRNQSWSGNCATSKTRRNNRRCRWCGPPLAWRQPIPGSSRHAALRRILYRIDSEQI